MTISEYLKNPYGKGSSFSGISERIESLSKELATFEDKVEYKIYAYQKTVIYHVVIPSTSNTNATYDVIIEVDIRNLKEGISHLEDCPIHVFSNCPSFIFTYANVFYNNKLLCTWLTNKYDAKVRSRLPLTTNRYGIIGLERSVYLAMKFLHNKALTKQSAWQDGGEKVIGRQKIISVVRTQDQIMHSVKDKVEGQTASDDESQKEKAPRSRHSPSAKYSKTTGTTKTAPRQKNSKTSGAVKKGKRTKSI